MTSQYRFADDFPYIRVKQVGLRMNSQDHQGHTIIASDGHTAAHVIWNTRADPFVTFSAGDHSRTYFITWDQTTLGWRPYLIGDPPRWNAAPSQQLLVIRCNHKTGEVTLDPLRWGLIPYWCKDPKGGRRPINAKCETVRDLPTFRDAYRKRRCIVPVDGFFEWKAIRGRVKQPYAIAIKDGGPFGLGGVWENFSFPHRPRNLRLSSRHPHRVAHPNGASAPKAPYGARWPTSMWKPATSP